MTELEKMWTRLEAHQPTADKLGYGAEWTRMCRLKTEEAKVAAWEAAWAAADAAWLVYEDASRGAELVYEDASRGAAAADSVMLQKAKKTRT